MTLSEAQVRIQVRLAVRRFKSQHVAALHCGVGDRFLSEVLNGKKKPSDKVTRALLGLTRQVVFVPTKGQESA